MGVSETVTLLALTAVVCVLLVLNRYFKARSLVTRMNLVILRQIKEQSLNGTMEAPEWLLDMCDEHDAALYLLAHGKYNKVVKDYSYIMSDERWEH